MKKIIALLCFVANIQVVFAQNKYADSLQTVLANATRPVEQFNLITTGSSEENDRGIRKRYSLKFITLIQIIITILCMLALIIGINW